MPRRKKQDEPMEEVKKIKTPPLVKGMKDRVSSNARQWNFLFSMFKSLADDFGFSWIDTSLLERFDLYSHTLGKNNEIVKNGLISFMEKNEKVAMRADFTPGIARSYTSHNLFNQTPPNKFYYFGKVFLQEKLALSKYREMFQVGYEVYNAKSPAVDAELIMSLYQLFDELGLSPQVRVNSLGCVSCRTNYAKALSTFIKSKRSAVCADCRVLAVKNPIKFLSCASQKCSKVLEEAPQTVDYLCDNCHDHMFKVLETLDELNVEYVLDSKLISDVNYYNGTIFSIYSKKEGSNGEIDRNALLAWGGRMDYLIQMLSGQDTPAVGIKLYLDQLVSLMNERKVEIPKTKSPHVYFAQLSEHAKRAAMLFVNKLRKEDFRVAANFSRDSLKLQLESATKMGAKIVLILGQKEATEGTIIIRDMESGIQEVVNQSKVIADIKKKLKNY